MFYKNGVQQKFFKDYIKYIDNLKAVSTVLGIQKISVNIFYDSCYYFSTNYNT